jgi:putative transposase
MKGKRYKEEQILSVLKELEGGKAVAELCREHGVSEPTLYRWRSKYGGLEDSELRRLKELEAENRRLRHVVSEQALDIAALKEAVSKKW